MIVRSNNEAIIENTLQDVSEPIVEVEIEPIIKLVIEPVAEPVIEPLVEPVIEIIGENKITSKTKQVKNLQFLKIIHPNVKVNNNRQLKMGLKFK